MCPIDFRKHFMQATGTTMHPLMDTNFVKLLHLRVRLTTSISIKDLFELT